MIPAARVQAAIELLDAIIAGAQQGGAAADTIVARYFKARRYAGSTDRRVVRDLVFGAIRRFGICPESGRAAMIGLANERPELLPLFDGSPHGPTAIVPGEAVAAPSFASDWLAERLDPLIDAREREALLERAPLDVRVNRLKADREPLLGSLPGSARTPISPIGLRLPEGFQVEEGQAYRSGEIEVQDEGSQLVCLACEAAPGMLAVDLCAGAGGKTLGLAAEMAGQGRLLACDTDRQRLGRMQPRLERAGITIVETRLLDPNREIEALEDVAGKADLVLVDAPCSGSGTWRRNPEGRWRLTPDRLSRLVKLQSDLLAIAERLVRPGGSLVYAVCSILRDEGRDQAANFSARSSLVPITPSILAGRNASPGLLLTPGHDGTDGFFVARWQRPC